MPSFRSMVLSGSIKSVKSIISGFSIVKQRQGMLLLDRIRPKPKDVRLRQAEGCPVEAMWAIPDHAAEGKVILYSHGGAYVTGSPATHAVILSRLAHQGDIAVLAYDYRLAPEHPYPAALEDAVAVYEYLLDSGYEPGNIAVCGDSAGGGLTLALVMALRDRGRPLPGVMCLLSPWTDLTDSGASHQVKKDDDPIIVSEELDKSAACYAGGEDLRSPLVSPLFGDFNGFPPTLIHVGSNEVLLDDSTRLATRMTEQGVKVEIEIFEGLWHVFQIYDIPEATKAVAKIVKFIRTTWEVNSMEKRTVRPGARYRHFKGKDYRVLYIARHSETLDEMVVYQQLYGEHGIWVRPLNMFLETVERDGKVMNRFEEVPEPTEESV